MKRLALVIGIALVGVVTIKAVAGPSGAANSGQITYDVKGRPVRISDGSKTVAITYCTDDHSHFCDIRWPSP